ncbi:hypothetical protein [Arthrobacter psychrolactophilus]|uniref:hypothetical protein n=1 Tax=Arthrobacter psychrolactophilus TaxID=92442 RepID=UPI0015E8D9DE|nr:hypothetical protein [Arthrobacter psychrolactophilus]
MPATSGYIGLEIEAEYKRDDLDERASIVEHFLALSGLDDDLGVSTCGEVDSAQRIEAMVEVCAPLGAARLSLGMFKD